MAYYSRFGEQKDTNDAFDGFNSRTAISNAEVQQPVFGSLMSYLGEQKAESAITAPTSDTKGLGNAATRQGASANRANIISKQGESSQTSLNMGNSANAVKATPTQQESTAKEISNRPTGPSRSFDANGRVVNINNNVQSIQTQPTANVQTGFKTDRVLNTNPLLHTTNVGTSPVTAEQQANLYEYGQYLRPHGVDESIWQEGMRSAAGKNITDANVYKHIKRNAWVSDRISDIRDRNIGYKDWGGVNGETMGTQISRGLKETNPLFNGNKAKAMLSTYSDENLKENISETESDDITQIINDLTNGAR